MQARGAVLTFAQLVISLRPRAFGSPSRSICILLLNESFYIISLIYTAHVEVKPALDIYKLHVANKKFGPYASSLDSYSRRLCKELKQIFTCVKLH